MTRRSVAAVILLVTGGAALAGWMLWRGRDSGRAAPGSPARATSVLLITIDTLRPDAVGAYGAAGAQTPAIDALARGGVLFERAFAVAPITLTSHATMLTGLYPPGHGARHNGLRMRGDVPTLAEAFRSAGARTGAFVSAFPLDRSFGLARGFDVYSDRMPRGADGRLANERPGRATVDEARQFLAASGKDRFFVWVHLFEPHAPYGDPADGRPVGERYAGDVAEADRQVARLLEALGDRRRDTVLVLAGDHGEAFGEHGEIAHSIFVYDTTLRVPLVIAAPGVGARRDARDVSLADIAPTVASLAGLSRWDGDGIDLRPRDAAPARSSRWLYAESFAPLLDFGWSSLRSLRLGRWKYIAAPRAELYDLDSDPAEATNVVREQGGRLAPDFQTRIDRISGPELPASASRIDPDARRRLQALGYASGSGGGAASNRRDPKDARQLAASIALITSGELRGDALERTLRRVLAEDPDNPQANLRLGYLRLESGSCGEAEALFARAIRNGMPGADAHLGRATCLGRRGAVREAVEALEAARDREPQNPVVLANIGIAAEALGDHARAIAALGGALAIDPDLHEARFNLALASARSGDRAAAAREARILLDRLPPDAPQRPEVERLLQAVR